MIVLLNFNNYDYQKAVNGEFTIRRRQDRLTEDSGYITAILGILIKNPKAKDLGVMMTILLSNEETQPIAGWLSSKVYFFNELCKSALLRNGLIDKPKKVQEGEEL